MTKTLWRELLYRRLAHEKLGGVTLDIGGDRKSGYHTLVHRDPSLISVANLERQGVGDIVCDLEQGIPSQDASYQSVLCINVLEHIFNYEKLLKDAHRVLRPDGTLIVAVPFLIAYHPSPRDYWRFTDETLMRIVTNAGFSDVKVETIGTGVFGALYQLSHGFLHFNSLRFVARAVARALDESVSFLKKDSVYSARYYPLGYVVVARK